MAGQAIQGLGRTPAVAHSHEGLASLTGPAGGLAASGTVPAGPVPATVAAGTCLALVSQAADEFGFAKLRVSMYTRCGGHETIPFVVLTSGCGRTAGVFSLLVALMYHIRIIFATFSFIDKLLFRAAKSSEMREE